ncbi:MAG: MBL fold metallo-hydrolase [Candidatus Latescibacteria bacterium]|nr:MBL fold metallo-hydrolase [bacterium]MBD3423928.1 MBL fold metallo-hydrolase [Candidatus Latescibacterota bacterium]
MELAILYDNKAVSGSFLSGWGFSCLARRQVLFDTGEDFESLQHNLEALDVDISALDTVVLSHNHWDHTGGLEGLLRKMDGGVRVYGCSDTDSSLIKLVRSSGGEFIEGSEPEEISDGIYTTGQIRGSYKESAIMEQSMVIETGERIAVVTGCSHPGIVNIIERVKEIFPEERVTLVLGGFHLKDKSPGMVYSIAERMKELGVEKAAPAHCTGDGAIDIFREIYGQDFISAGAGKVMEV